MLALVHRLALLASLEAELLGVFSGRFGVTQRALDRCTELFGAAGFGLGPGAILEGWAVSDVLAVSAGELGDPVAREIAMKAGDRGGRHAPLTPGVRERRSCRPVR